MQSDIDQMSREDLVDLRSQIDTALASLDERKKESAREAAEAAIEGSGFSLEEILAFSPKKGKKNPPKYSNPEDPQQTWSGRGRKPKWLKDGLDQGKSLEDFAIV